MLTAPSNGRTPAERVLALSIVGARRTLYVADPHFLPDDDFRRLFVPRRHGLASTHVDMPASGSGERRDAGRAPRPTVRRVVTTGVVGASPARASQLVR